MDYLGNNCYLEKNVSSLGLYPDSRTFTPFPSITLKGNWMKAAGFETGQKIEVLAGPGQLIVRLAAEG